MRRRIGLIVIPIFSVILYGALGNTALPHEGRATAAVAFLMAGWWITEALPIPITALLPIPLFPLLGVTSMEKATAPYAHKLIFLFLGGFFLASAMQRWDLHRRLALNVLKRVGSRPSFLVAGFMGVTAFLSMWVSNTTTVIMMLPMGLSVMELVRGDKNFAKALLLGLAYAASIGGVATLIGTPPNTLLAAFISNTYGQTISFYSWLKIGLPFLFIFLPLTWVVLTYFLFPLRQSKLEGSQEMFERERSRLGRMKAPEKTVMIVFILTALAWIFRPLVAPFFPFFKQLDDTGIAMLCALLLFLLPAWGEPKKRILDWEVASKIPWGVLLLFGGGLTLASAIVETGVAGYLGHHLEKMGAIHPFVLVVGVTTVMIFLTELTSNTAVTASFLPILGAMAAGTGVNPYLLLVPATVAASCAFMLPTATPPNALVFASGAITIPEMCRAGLWLNLLGIILISVILYWGIGVLP